MSEVFLLLGGNEGNKHKIFSETTKLIREKIGEIIQTSSIYESEPWGFVSDLFWNQAVVVSTTLTPEDLLTVIHEIEKFMGRIQISANYEPRPIDIDILFYNELQINTDQLTIPHPLIPQRKFALVPLNEIAENKIHPVTGLTINQMLQNCSDQLNISRIENADNYQ